LTGNSFSRTDPESPPVKGTRLLKKTSINTCIVFTESLPDQFSPLLNSRNNAARVNPTNLMIWPVDPIRTAGAPNIFPVAARHKLRANACFLDGHIESLNVTQLKDMRTYWSPLNYYGWWLFKPTADPAAFSFSNMDRLGALDN
jgi:prepilin-type processing-associated H-X9-DG protein